MYVFLVCCTYVTSVFQASAYPLNYKALHRGFKALILGGALGMSRYVSII